MAYDIQDWVDEGIAQRRHRWVRWTLAAGMLSFLAASVIEIRAGAGEPGDLMFGAPLLLGLFGLITALFSPFSRSLWRPGRGTPFDERERAQLILVHARAFQTVALVVIAGLLWCWLAGEHGLWVPHSHRDWGAMLRFAALGLAALPILIAEWTIPLLPADEEEA